MRSAHQSGFEIPILVDFNQTEGARKFMQKLFRTRDCDIHVITGEEQEAFPVMDDRMSLKEN